jgi:hypothetical protein
MRKIINDDIFNWFSDANDVNDDQYSYVASMPDYSEFPNYKIEEWKNWFEDCAKKIIESTADNEFSIFYQSDLKKDGVWFDKSFLIMKAAEKSNSQLLWHKIICRVPPGKVTFGRPAYSHILCFSKKFKLDPSHSTADVIPHVGDKTWERGMGLEACIILAEFIKKHSASKKVVNLFCGMGSFVSVADAYELEVIGIERSKKRAEESAQLKFNLKEKIWL